MDQTGNTKRRENTSNAPRRGLEKWRITVTGPILLRIGGLEQNFSTE